MSNITELDDSLIVLNKRKENEEKEQEAKRMKEHSLGSMNLLTDFSSAFNFSSAISAFGNLAELVDSQGKVIKNLEEKLSQTISSLYSTNNELNKSKSIVRDQGDKIKMLNRIIESNELEDLSGEEIPPEEIPQENLEEMKEAIEEQYHRESEFKPRPLTSHTQHNSRPSSSNYMRKQQEVIQLKEEVDGLKSMIQRLHERLDNYDRSLYGTKEVDPSSFITKPVSPYIAFQRSSIVMDQPPHLLIGLKSNGSRPNSSHGIASSQSPKGGTSANGGNSNSSSAVNSSGFIDDIIPEGEYEDNSLAYNIGDHTGLSDGENEENEISYYNDVPYTEITSKPQSVTQSANNSNLNSPKASDTNTAYNDSVSNSNFTSKPTTGRSKNSSRAPSRNNKRDEIDRDQTPGIPRYPSNPSSSRVSIESPYESSNQIPLSSRGSSRFNSRPLTSRSGPSYQLRKEMCVSNLPSSLTKDKIDKILIELSNRGKFLLKNKKILEEEKKNYASQSFRQRIDLLEINLTETKRKVESQNILIKKLKSFLYDNVLSKNFSKLIQFYEIYDNAVCESYGIAKNDSEEEKISSHIENCTKNIAKFLLNEKLLESLSNFDFTAYSTNTNVPIIDYVNPSSNNHIGIPLLKSISIENGEIPFNGGRSRTSSYASPTASASLISDQNLNQVIQTVKNTLISPFEKAIDQEIREYRNKLIELSSDMLTKNDLNNMLKLSNSNSTNNDSNFLKLMNVVKYCLENYNKSNISGGKNQLGNNSSNNNNMINFEDGSLVEYFKTNEQYKQYFNDEIVNRINGNDNINKILLNLDELNSSYTANLIRVNKLEEQMSLIYDKLLYNENMREILTLEHNKLEQKRIDDYETLMVLQKKISNISLEKLIEELKTVQINLLNRPSSDDIKVMINNIEDTFKNHLGENVVGLRSLVHEVALRLHNKADRTDIRELINRKLNQIEADLLLHEKGGENDFTSSLTSKCLGCGQATRPSAYLNFPLNSNNGPNAYVSSANGSKNIVFDDDSTIVSGKISPNTDIQSLLTGQTGLKPLHLAHNNSTPIILNKKKDKGIHEPLPSSNVRKAKLQAHIQNSVKLALNSAENYGISNNSSHNYVLDNNDPGMTSSFSLPEIGNISPVQPMKRQPLIITASNSRGHLDK